MGIYQKASNDRLDIPTNDTISSSFKDPLSSCIKAVIQANPGRVDYQLVRRYVADNAQAYACLNNVLSGTSPTDVKYLEQLVSEMNDEVE